MFLNKTIAMLLVAAALVTSTTVAADAALKPKGSQAKIDVTVDATGVGAEGIGNATITAIVGGHSQSRPLGVDVGTEGEQNETQDLSEIYIPFNFRRLSSEVGDQFSVCFNSDVANVTSTCSDGVLKSAEKGKGKGHGPTKLRGTADLII